MKSNDVGLTADPKHPIPMDCQSLSWEKMERKWLTSEI
jgi:hypothetical protein